MEKWSLLERNQAEFWVILASIKNQDAEGQLRLARKLHELCDQWDEAMSEGKASTFVA